MALFSSPVAALFPVEDMPISLHYGEKTSGSTMRVFHFKGSLALLMDTLRQEGAISGNPLSPYLMNADPKSWHGCRNGETMQDMISRAHCETAFRDFEEAKAAIHEKPTRDKPRLSPVGGSFSMGRVIVGHPVAAFNRPRVALKPVRLEYAISVSSSVNAREVSSSMARILSAAHQYHIAGGAVKIIVHYSLLFRAPNPQTGAKGIVFSLELPINNGSLAAFGGSIQFFRAVAIPTAQALSGTRHDSLQCGQFTRGAVTGIHGKATDADTALSALKIA